jgi:hypothetical protein
MPRIWGATRRHANAKRTARHRKQAQAPTAPPRPRPSLRPFEAHSIEVPSQEEGRQ